MGCRVSSHPDRADTKLPKDYLLILTHTINLWLISKMSFRGLSDTGTPRSAVSCPNFFQLSTPPKTEDPDTQAGLHSSIYRCLQWIENQMDDFVWFCLMLFNIDILTSVAAHIDIRISICIVLICEQTWYWCRFQRMERDINTEYPLLRSEGYTRYQVTNSIIEPKMDWFHIKKKSKAEI